MKKWAIPVLLIITFPVLAQKALPGEALARQYCGSCHLFPSPDLLPAKTWTENVLPNMGTRLGVKSIKKDQLKDKSAPERKILDDLNVYSKVQLLTDAQWEAIVNYYAQNAPAEPLPQPEKPEPLPLTGFSVNQMTLEGKPVPKTTMLYGNNLTGELFLGDASNRLYVKDKQNNLYSLPEINSPPVKMARRAEGIYDILCIGSIDPSDLSAGRIYEADFNRSGWSVLIDSLARPVDLLWADLESDGRPDLLVCNFGNNLGHLSLYPDGDRRREKILLYRPGTRKAEVHDFNNDGRPDILVMYCQGREGMSILYNRGNGEFEEKEILEFHPLMGLSYFQLADFNGDGQPDILLSNGDNWDYSKVSKNYHGIRIFINKGEGRFELAWFYPQYGVSKSVACDFDHDGKPEIVSIAFYDNLENPADSFLYFKNTGEMNFQPYRMADAALGKWITLEVADLDQDGDADIYLGSYFHNTTEFSKFLVTGQKEYPQVLILTNQTVP